MTSFRKILFPTDFSAQSERSIAYAAGIAREFGSELALLHACNVYDTFGYGAASGMVVTGVSEGDLLRHREENLESFGKRQLENLTVSRTVEFGEPAERIAHYVKEHGVDLIFMPTHGRGKFRQLLLGSVTSKVLHDVRCPVWTTAHSDVLSMASFKRLETITCALDLSEDEDQTLMAARDIAQRFSSIVNLVHVISSPEMEPGGIIEDAPFQRFLRDAAQKRIDAMQTKAQTNFAVCIRYGSIPAAIRDCATETKTDLVVIGRGHQQRLLWRLRSSVGAIIQESPCPVFSV